MRSKITQISHQDDIHNNTIRRHIGTTYWHIWPICTTTVKQEGVLRRQKYSLKLNWYRQMFCQVRNQHRQSHCQNRFDTTEVQLKVELAQTSVLLHVQSTWRVCYWHIFGINGNLIDRKPRALCWCCNFLYSITLRSECTCHSELMCLHFQAMVSTLSNTEQQKKWTINQSNRF